MINSIAIVFMFLSFFCAVPDRFLQMSPKQREILLLISILAAFIIIVPLPSIVVYAVLVSLLVITIHFAPPQITIFLPIWIAMSCADYIAIGRTI
jgi:hypothetical protein